MPRRLIRPRTANRIRRRENSVPWTAIAAAGRPVGSARRTRRRTWWLIPAATVVCAIGWLILTATAHAPAGGRVVRVAANGGRSTTGASARSATGTVSGHRSAAARRATDPFTPSLRAWLRGRGTDVSAAVEDLHSGRTWVYRPGHPMHTASIVKVDILATLLHEDDGTLQSEDLSTATEMIEASDDDDATDLWDDEGGAAAVQSFSDAARMRHTAVNVAWGLTTTTPEDQLRLLRTILFPNRLLSARSRAFEYGLMRHVIPFDTWGVTAGPLHHAKVAFKNGWLPYDGAWQVNSIGSVRGDGRHYLIAVMTDGSSSEGEGIDTIQRISRSAWGHLNAG